MANSRRRGSFKIDQQIRRFKALKKTLPIILANQAQNHFTKGFEKGGGQTDDSRAGWAPRKRGRTRKQRERDTGRAILVKIGDLRNDIKRRKTRFERSVVSTRNIPYADIHNRGLQGLAFGKYTFQMPKREYIGPSRILAKKEVNTINKELKKIKR